jgi:hypothetical protein
MNWAWSTTFTAQDLPEPNNRLVRRVAALRGVPGFDHGEPASQLASHRDEFFAAVNPATLNRFEELFNLLNATEIS